MHGEGRHGTEGPLFHHWVLEIELRLSVLVANTFIYPLIHFTNLSNSCYIYLSVCVVRGRAEWGACVTVPIWRPEDNL